MDRCGTGSDLGRRGSAWERLARVVRAGCESFDAGGLDERI